MTLLKFLNGLLTALIITGVCVAIGFIIFLRKHEINNKKEMNKTKDKNV
jgi:hypothetical protein